MDRELMSSFIKRLILFHRSFHMAGSRRSELWNLKPLSEGCLLRNVGPRRMHSFAAFIILLEYGHVLIPATIATATGKLAGPQIRPLVLSAIFSIGKRKLQAMARGDQLSGSPAYVDAEDGVTISTTSLARRKSNM